MLHEKHSYGGAYDIRDDQFFTREDLVDFGNELVDELNQRELRQYSLNQKYDLADISLDDDILSVEIQSDDISLEYSQKIDMRRIRLPKDLMKYKNSFLFEFEKQIEAYKKDLNKKIENNEEDPVIESGTEFSFNSITYLPISKEALFLSEVEPMAIWKCSNVDTLEISYFVTFDKTGLIEWGPCETFEEAADFVDDFNLDEDFENKEELEKTSDDCLNEASEESDDKEELENISHRKIKLLKETVEAVDLSKLKKKFFSDNTPGGHSWNAVDLTHEEMDAINHFGWKEMNDKKRHSFVTLTDSEYDEIFNESIETQPEEEVASTESPKDESATGVSNLLIDQINEEWGTIQNYNSVILALKEEGKEEFIPIIEDIIVEENLHIGQLQECLKKLSPNTENIQQGEEEAREELDKS